MSVRSLTRALEDSSNCILYEPPQRLTIDEDAKTLYSTSMKLDTLIIELREKGPFVAFGYIGPQCYKLEPFALTEELGGQKIFGWSPGTHSGGEKTHVFVLGARKVEDKEYIYFSLSMDCTRDTKTYIREHRLTSDKKIYVCSHKTFVNKLEDCYPPVAEEKMHPNFVSSGSVRCSKKELDFVIKLVSIMPVESILGVNETFCRELGQKIFDTFKKDQHDDTSAGREAVTNVCNAMTFCAKDGPLRQQFLARAWNKIGDENWRWWA